MQEAQQKPWVPVQCKVVAGGMLQAPVISDFMHDLEEVVQHLWDSVPAMQHTGGRINWGTCRCSADGDRSIPEGDYF